MTNPLLEAKQLNAWYGAAQILFDVDLHVNRGEVVALMGRNGAGKSTTLKALMGLLAKRKGRIHFLGRDVSKAEPHDVAGRLSRSAPGPGMSNALAIASVTRVLKDLLNNGLIDHDVSDAVGGNVTVTALPPDRILGPPGTAEHADLSDCVLHASHLLGSGGRP